MLYGQGLETTPLTVDSRELTHLLHGSAGSNVLVDLVVDGEEHLAIPREIQRDHIHSKWVHVDFLAVSRARTITVGVPVHEMGDAAGVKEGGVVEHHLPQCRSSACRRTCPTRSSSTSPTWSWATWCTSTISPPAGVTILEPRGRRALGRDPGSARVEADLSVPGEEGVEVPVAEVEEGVEVPAAEGEAPAEGGEAAAEEEGGEG